MKERVTLAYPPHPLPYHENQGTSAENRSAVVANILFVLFSFLNYLAISQQKLIDLVRVSSKIP